MIGWIIRGRKKLHHKKMFPSAKLRSKKKTHCRGEVGPEEMFFQAVIKHFITTHLLVFALCFSTTVSTSGPQGTFSIPIKLKPKHDMVLSQLPPTTATTGSSHHFNGTLTGMFPTFRRKKGGESDNKKQSKTKHDKKHASRGGKYSFVPINHYVVGTVVFGNQPLEVIFDSGSTLVWVFGKGANKDKFITKQNERGEVSDFQHKFYDRKKSKTLKKRGSTTRVQEHYADGTAVSGQVGFETIRVGDIIMKDTGFGIVDSFDGPDHQFIDYDGIFGLSFYKLRRSTKRESKARYDPKLISPFMKMTEMGVLKRNMYSVFMAEDGSTGEICFGGWNEKHFKGDINVVSVVLGKDKKKKYDNEWLVELNHVGFGKVVPLPGSSWRALIDTGSTAIMMPKSVVVKTCTDYRIQRALLNPDNPGLVPCGSRHTLPKLEFHIGGEKYSLSGTEYSIVENYVDEEGKEVELCTLLIVAEDTAVEEADGSMNEIVIGAPFLRKYYTMFDFGENPEDLPKIHFAEAVHSGGYFTARRE